MDTFNNPLVALQNFTAGSYDLLLLDMLVPKMNGFELYQKMIMLDDKVKICFLTASEVDQAEFRKKAALLMPLKSVLLSSQLKIKRRLRKISKFRNT
jgi:DNA-binding response OmpR family regulator